MKYKLYYKRFVFYARIRVVRMDIIGHARIKYVAEHHSCMVRNAMNELRTHRIAVPGSTGSALEECAWLLLLTRNRDTERIWQITVK